MDLLWSWFSITTANFSSLKTMTLSSITLLLTVSPTLARLYLCQLSLRSMYRLREDQLTSHSHGTDIFLIKASFGIGSRRSAYHYRRSVLLSLSESLK